MSNFHPTAAALLLLASGTVAITPAAEASGYKCFDRQTGEQVAVSEIDITTPSVSCLPDEGSTSTGPNWGSDSDPNPGESNGGSTGDAEDDDDDFTPGQGAEDSDDDDDTSPTPSPSTPTPSTPSPSSPTLDPLAARRAINLARGTAVSLNGGLSQYRPGACMFASTKDNPCITRADSEGIEFTIPGGPPGWEQSGDTPTTITVVVISADGRSVLQSRNN